MPICISATTELILGFKAPFKPSGGNNWVEICFKYCALILSRNTDNQSLAWKLWITKCTRANGNFIGSEINMKGQAYRWPCGGWMAVREERQSALFFNYPMHLLKEESQLPKCEPATSGAGPKGMGWGHSAEWLVTTARRPLRTAQAGRAGRYAEQWLSPCVVWLPDTVFSQNWHGNNALPQHSDQIEIHTTQLIFLS